MRVDAELLVNPFRILIYPRSGGLQAVSDDRAEEIIANIIDALEYLGHQVEKDFGSTWDLQPGDWEKYK